MNTPHNGERGERNPHSPAEQSLSNTVSTVEHWLFGVTGFLFTGVVVALLYPALVAVTRPLHLLSSTALVAIFIMAWLLTWFAIECVWEWRTGRLTTAAYTLGHE